MPYAHQHSSDSCKKDCISRCDANIAVDVDVNPKVSCKQRSQRGTDFDIAVDIDVKPRCRLNPKCSYVDDKGCTTRCEFTVEVDFDCHPKIKCLPCGKPHAEFDVDVEIEYQPKCAPSKAKGDWKYGNWDGSKKQQQHDSSNSKYADYSDCDCDDCKPKSSKKKC